MTDHAHSKARALVASAALAVGLTVGGGLIGASPAAAETPVDRCGSQGTEWVPDRGPGFDFADSCHRHDLCYGNKPHGAGSAGRKACDQEFLRDAYGQCADGRGIIGRLWCQDVADNYYVGIRIGGGGPFDRAEPPVGIVIVGEPETVPYNPTVTVGEPEPVRDDEGDDSGSESTGGGGGGGGRGGGYYGGGFGGWGSFGGGGGSSSGGTVTVGEPETVQE